MVATPLFILQENDEIVDLTRTDIKDSGMEKFKTLLGIKADRVFKNGKAHSFHLWKYNTHSKLRYVDIIENKSGFNVQIYFSKGMEESLDKVVNDIKQATGLGEINKNRDYISSKNCDERSALAFLRFVLEY